ncbi:MAG: hypothetical protein DRQ51_00350 [Gammaproteobacteria bacterium]|nr:MAG: hypothetical protein DRQ51_00350 [Gammaproteobacteria bacterium]
MIKKLLFLIFILTLISCQSAPDKPLQHTWVIQNPEAGKMWQLSEDAIKKNEYFKADEYLTQAQKLSPKNPAILSRHAEVKLRIRKSILAENLAMKSNSFANNEKNIVYRNWSIIEHARTQRGDIPGAKEAQLQIQKLMLK